MTERKMKDSGIPWIGMIPEEWEVKPVSSCFKERWNLNKELKETNLLSLSYGKVVNKDINTSDGLLPKSFNNYNIIEPYDIVFRFTDLQNDQRSLRTGLSTQHGIITSAYVTIKFREKDNCAPYFHYVFHTYDICKVFYGIGGGVRQGMSFGDLRRMNIPLPPIAEQEAIAVWLDRKCGEVDELIEVEQKMIEELEAYRQATITETVTRGLNPDVPMRQTSISWLPEIPKHWNLCRLKCLCYRMQSGDALTSMQINSSGKYRVYGGNGLRGYYDKSNFTGEAIIIGRQGALCGNVHYINGSIWATDHAVVTTPSPLSNIKYLYYLTLGMNLNQYASQTAAQPGLAVGQIKNVLTVNPPLAEQQAIADYLDTKCKEIDELIAVKREKIETLKQYRQSIIFEAVTGKTQIN